MASEIIVLIDVGEDETALIRGLISSFEIELCALDRDEILKRGRIFQDNPVCLVILQEYVEGQTLSHLLALGLSSGKKEDIFFQLLSVTAYVHHHSVMHRDIKPNNIIVTPNGNVNLLDFGIAEDLVW